MLIEKCPKCGSLIRLEMVTDRIVDLICLSGDYVKRNVKLEA